MLNYRAVMIGSIGAVAALPRQLAADPPLCMCETYLNGLDATQIKEAKTPMHGCMAWRKNNPHLSHDPLGGDFVQMGDVFNDPSAGWKPGGKGQQVACTKADPGLKTGAAEEFDKGWQGGCPSDTVKCTLLDASTQRVAVVRSSLYTHSSVRPRSRDRACVCVVCV